MIKFTVEDEMGQTTSVTVPEGIQLNLMEVLKASEFPIMATCGGLALCATCRVKVIAGENQLPPPADAEQDMLDNLPFEDGSIRLSCQLQVNGSLNDCVFKIIPE